MKFFFLLFSLLPAAHAAKHTLTYYLTAASGGRTLPEFMAVSKVDGVQVGYCDNVINAAEYRQDWAKKLVADDAQLRKWHMETCAGAHQVLQALITSLKQHYNQTGGIHVFQEMSTCEWDDVTEEISGSQRFSYDGEDFISLDIEAKSWVYTRRGDTFRNKWDPESVRLDYSLNILQNICPQWLKKYWQYGKSALQRKDLPSVSLLQKSPSSPVRCHATGFYPDRAEMLWRKDGREIHMGVEKGEILPNHDGSFQLSVDLTPSSDRPEDWSRYECVFQLSGVKDVDTKLDKTAIRTNQDPPSEFPVGAVVGGVVGLLLLILCVCGLLLWRKRKNGFRPANTSDSEPSPVKDVPLNGHGSP